jgi:transposase
VVTAGRAASGRQWKRCASCRTKGELEAERDTLREQVDRLAGALDESRQQLAEALKLVDLQKADLERYQLVFEQQRPNQPERVAREQLQLAFERVLETLADAPAANDLARAVAQDRANGRGGGRERRRDPHGRRPLETTNLPVETVTIEPAEVLADGGEGWERIGEEVGERVAYQRGRYIRYRVVRGKWVRKGPTEPKASSPRDGAGVEDEEREVRSVVVLAPLPPSVWPRSMADPSACAHHIVSKYDDLLPLHRQERMSRREGFVLPRSTQCGWLGASYPLVYRVVDAMFEEGKRESFCIATDATGAPVRAPGRCESWHVFVFLMDQDHVVFRYSAAQNNAEIRRMLEPFRGHLLADAASIYDRLFSGGDMIEVACWAHLRRYLWRSLETDRHRALEALAIVGKLFEVERTCRDVPMPERTAVRAARAGPILEFFDEWVRRHSHSVDPRGPLDRAIGYYENQRLALRRFLEDGRLRIDNNLSEGALRNLVLGRCNWYYFANETGLRWYTTFRSLIASCYLHDLEPQDYLEQLLRLAPHWPTSRVIELAPKHWAATVARLGDDERAILVPPWSRAENVTVRRVVAPRRSRIAA